MNNLNSVLIEGNLAREPQVLHIPNGSTVCNFTIASNRYLKGEDCIEKEVCFFDIEAFGKLGEHCYNIGKKGRGVRVVGRLKQERWKGEDGKNYAKIVIVSEHVEFRPEFNRKRDTTVNLETEECINETVVEEVEEVVA